MVCSVNDWKSPSRMFGCCVSLSFFCLWSLRKRILHEQNWSHEATGFTRILLPKRSYSPWKRQNWIILFYPSGRTSTHIENVIPIWSRGSVAHCFRLRSHDAVMIWKRNKIITERPPIHTMPAWKSSEDGTKWKRNSCRYEMKTELYPASFEHLSIRNRIITVPGQWCRFQLIPASCERGLNLLHNVRYRITERTAQNRRQRFESSCNQSVF